MPKLWAKLIKKGKTIKHHTIEIKDIETDLKRKVDQALEEICSHFDIEYPMWLQDTEKGFNNFRKTSFTAMHFIDDIDFDRLELELIVEKKKKNQS